LVTGSSGFLGGYVLAEAAHTMVGRGAKPLTDYLDGPVNIRDALGGQELIRFDDLLDGPSNAVPSCVIFVPVMVAQW
jgi:hypothetical protein